jgi:hypothetical protein
MLPMQQQAIAPTRGVQDPLPGVESAPAISAVPRDEYVAHLRKARKSSPLIRTMTSPAKYVPPEAGAQFQMSSDRKSGYYVGHDGYLGGVYSREKGRGDTLVKDAVQKGASHLDAFDGYLPKLYSKHGFSEDKREANWTPGGPDVVYMSRKQK